MDAARRGFLFVGTRVLLPVVKSLRTADVRRYSQSSGQRHLRALQSCGTHLSDLWLDEAGEDCWQLSW